ncbi:RING finger domain-containing protein [Parendozoicomonas sp. Alg238-R29]|uniref:RING finger domain-containing protein n=1 Tax=Parendozoicomonas sp. Alg238-R29 TaxID=2993446 RepID=UPI00248DAB8D|nr:RING finger domain-containing protein [Parendozoicomonas sp. Alg238-R29]
MARPVNCNPPTTATPQCGGSCAVCLDDMFNVSPVEESVNKNRRYGVTRDNRHIRLNCGHAFHKDCAVGCLRAKSECPLCRHKVEPYVLNNINRQLNTDLRVITAEENMNEVLREDLVNGHRDRNSTDNQMLWEAELQHRATPPSEPMANHNRANNLFSLLFGERPVRREPLQFELKNPLDALINALFADVAEQQPRPRRRYRRTNYKPPVDFNGNHLTNSCGRAHSGKRHRVHQVRREPVHTYHLTIPPCRPKLILRQDPYRSPFRLLDSLDMGFSCRSQVRPNYFGLSQPARWFGDDMMLQQPRHQILIF